MLPIGPLTYLVLLIYVDREKCKFPSYEQCNNRSYNARVTTYECEIIEVIRYC